jgi:DNA repair protein RecN (Recombination protein N)
MLTALRIRNFAIIEEASLALGPGLNVLSGETGAGKTIIMTALGLLLGGRASPEMVRAGAKEAVVEAVFELEGEVPPEEARQWLSEDNPRELLIRRVIAEGGRSRVTVNDTMVTVQTLARLGEALVEIYGQHDQQVLMERESHLRMLDRHAGLEGELAGYRKRFDHARELQGRLRELERRDAERAERLEIARFRATELQRADLRLGEDEELAAARNVLANATRLAAAAGEAEQALYGGENAAVDTIADAQAKLADAASLDPALSGPLDLIGTARANLEEAARALAAYAGRIEADPACLEELETRLQELTRLKRKYGGTIASALEALERTTAEISELETLSDQRSAIEAELNKSLDDLLERAERLSARRQRDAKELKRRMEAELKTLAMRSAVFAVRFSQVPNSDDAITRAGTPLGPEGFDSAEFLLAPNLGQPPLPLAKAASGGELSRVMLALKRLEAQRRGVATVIFDEVDAGIGGAVGAIVGRKLRELARFHQVLCVTHLAQIAAFAGSHFVVEKQERRGTTRSRVAALETADRPAEIARMLGGDTASDKFLRAAHELIDRATG